MQFLEDFAVCSQPGYSNTHHIRTAANARIGGWLSKTVIRKNEVDSLFGREHAARFGKVIDRLKPFIAGADRNRLNELRDLVMELPVLVSGWMTGKGANDHIEGACPP